MNGHHIVPGDKLVSHDGKQIEVLSVELTRAEDVEVFNLTIYNTHTFALGDDAWLITSRGATSWQLKGWGISHPPPQLNASIVNEKNDLVGAGTGQ